MPAGEPGGPDSEVFYQFAQVAHHPKFGKQCHPNCDCGRFLEIGNSVFMEYRKNTDGTFSELPKKNVDFGGGLERILAALNNNPDMFITDIYQPIINRLGTSLNISYSGEKNKAVLRIIADHIKASSLLIKNGVSPGNKEQGYFLRRLIRRMVVKARNILGRLITVKEFDKAIDGVMEIYNQIYFEQADENIIKPVINEEINRFSTTLEKGLREINKLKEIDGKIAFDLYQSYGFPLEITEEIFKEKGQKIDKVQFAQEFKKHKNLSRQSAAGRFRGGLADQNEQTIRYHTATHLLHQALFNVLGSEIRQEGSNITSERLRFDFYSLKKPGDEELKRVETVVNEQIKKGLAVYSKVIAKAEAQEIGAKSFFREKYPDIVKVYFIEGFSKEFCGGPHVKNTSEIGEIKIFKFEKIGGNLYRIYAK
jgi:alanyl-tRNA synthetase